jgi:hypothetical protein
VEARGADVVRQLHDVLDDALLVELAGTRNLGLPVTAHVDAHHAKVAREMRHPRVEAPGATHRGVDQDQRVGRLPRIGEIVDGVSDSEAVRRLELLHCPACFSIHTSSCLHYVIARSGSDDAIPWRTERTLRDCFVAALLAMTCQ